jgi:hypothetical protein
MERRRPRRHGVTVLSAFDKLRLTLKGGAAEEVGVTLSLSKGDA